MKRGGSMKHRSSWAGMIALAVAIAVLRCAPARGSVLRPDWPPWMRAPRAAALIAERRGAGDGSALAQNAIEPGTARVERTAAEAPLSDYLVRRHRQYAEAFVTGAAMLLLMIFAALWFRRRDAVGAGLAALGALGIGALLQFSASSGITAVMWPPPYLWLGTFAGTFMLAVMFAAVAAVMLRPGFRRGTAAILIAEAVWWLIPDLGSMSGLTWGMAQRSISMDWLIFLGTAAGAIAAPAAAWALASLCGLLAERIVPART
jgi:hypothetical protein